MNSIFYLILFLPFVLLTGYLWLKLSQGYGYGHPRGVMYFLCEIVMAVFKKNAKLPFTYGKDATVLSRAALLSVVLVITIVLAALISPVIL